jgi:CDP-diacylglycerol--glycerol-3-phosphate 3-phosphatidyltransferase
MISQVLAISVVLIGLRHPGWRTAGSVCMWLVVFFAITSAIGYFVKFWRHIDESVKLRRRSELLQEERRRLEARQRGSETGSGVGVRT